jgi:high affinity sulfate transporter 1
MPILGGVLPIDPQRIPVDIIAGITLAALAIPEVMGYTKIAGMPVITGLYTILIPIAIFALFGASRHLVVGADSATAAIMFAGIATLATPASPQWVTLAAWLAILSAGFLFLGRVLRLGFLADFLSMTVLVGFLTGVGIQVACGQIAGMLGVAKTGNGAILQAYNAIVALPSANKATMVVSAGVLVLIVGSRLISKKIPGALIAVVGAIVASQALDLSAKGVATLGSIPSGLPAFSIPALPTFAQLTVLVPTAASLFLVILAQSAATSRAYATKYDEAFDENIDLVGLGLANVAAGLTGTFVVNGSPTKTQMVDTSGGRSQISQLTTAAIVLIVLLFLTKPLSYMPNAVLAAVVFLIGVELVDIKGMRRILSARPVEFWIAAVTAFTVVVVGVEQGILLAIAISIVAHVRHSYRPVDRLVTYEGEQRNLHPLESGAQAAPGLIIYHFGANLYYANAQAFQEEVLGLVSSASPKVTTFALDASSIEDVDYSGAEVLRKLVAMLKERGVTFAMVELDDAPRKELVRSDLVDSIGTANIYGGLHDIVESCIQSLGNGHHASAGTTTEHG